MYKSVIYIDINDYVKKTKFEKIMNFYAVALLRTKTRERREENNTLIPTYYIR